MSERDFARLGSLSILLNSSFDEHANLRASVESGAVRRTKNVDSRLGDYLRVPAHSTGNCSMGNKDTKPNRDTDRIVCRNRKAQHEYEILDQLDCGIMLHGSEVKSVRNNKITIDEGFAKVEKGEVWLYNVDISEYTQANVMNHPLRRPRKLLLKKREIAKFAARADESGMSLIPLDVHFSRGFVKVKLGVGKGRKQHDKREKLKSDDARREIQQAMRKKFR